MPDNNIPLICLGKIITPHGIKGEVKVKSFTEPESNLFNYTPLYNHDKSKTYELTIRAQSNEHFICTINNISNRTEAESLKGRKLYITKDMLPKTNDIDEFYHEDLIGMHALLTDGTPYGTVKAIVNYGASDIIEISKENSKETELFAFTKQTVPNIDLDKKTLILNPPEVIIGKEK